MHRKWLVKFAQYFRVSRCKLLTEFSREHHGAGGRPVMYGFRGRWSWKLAALIVCGTWGTQSRVIIDRRMTQRMRRARENLSSLLMAHVQTIAMPTELFDPFLSADIWRRLDFVPPVTRSIWFNDSVMDPRSNCREPATRVSIVLYCIELRVRNNPHPCISHWLIQTLTVDRRNAN